MLPQNIFMELSNLNLAAIVAGVIISVMAMMGNVIIYKKSLNENKVWDAWMASMLIRVSSFLVFSLIMGVLMKSSGFKSDYNVFLLILLAVVLVGMIADIFLSLSRGHRALGLKRAKAEN